MVAVLSRKEAANTYGLPTGRALRRALKDWFRQQRRAVVSYLKTGRIERKDEGGGDVTSIPGWDDFFLGDLPMSERMAPLISAIWQEQGEEFLVRLGLDPNAWDVTNPYLGEAIDQAALDFCAATNATTSKQLSDAIAATREAIQEGLIEQGESLDWLTKRINEIFDQAENWRARRIAASEASRAAHSAQEKAAYASEVVTGWRWLASDDACPLCLTIARRCEFVPLGQPFAKIGDHPTYSIVRFPPAHVSCQCSMVEVLDTDEQPKWSETLVDPEPKDQDYEAAGVELAEAKAMRPPRAMRPRPLVRKAMRS